MASEKRLTKAYRKLFPLYLAAVALGSPLRFVYSFLKDHNVTPLPWYELAGNMCMVPFIVICIVGWSIFFGIVLMFFLFVLSSPIRLAVRLIAKDRVRAGETFDMILQGICGASMALIFLVLLVFITYTSGRNILAEKLSSDVVSVFLPRWVGILIGGLILLPCYIIFFQIVRSWLRETFPSDPEVKDALE